MWLIYLFKLRANWASLIVEFKVETVVNFVILQGDVVLVGVVPLLEQDFVGPEHDKGLYKINETLTEFQFERRSVS